MTTTEYALQYQFKPRGHWYTDENNNNYTELHLAQIGLKFEKTKSKVYVDYPKRWRIVKREVTEWEEVSNA